jgi:hypothetical protein
MMSESKAAAATAASTASNHGQRLDFNSARLDFAHAETLMPLLSLLGLHTRDFDGFSNRTNGSGVVSGFAGAMQTGTLLPRKLFTGREAATLRAAASFAALAPTTATSAKATAAVVRESEGEQERDWRMAAAAPMAGSLQLTTWRCAPALPVPTSPPSDSSEDGVRTLMQLSLNEAPTMWPGVLLLAGERQLCGNGWRLRAGAEQHRELVTDLCPLDVIESALQRRFEQLGVKSCGEEDWAAHCAADDDDDDDDLSS